MISLAGYTNKILLAIASASPERLCAFAAENDVPIEEMGLSPKARNILHFNKIRSISRLFAMDEAELQSLSMMSADTANEIRMLMGEYLTSREAAIWRFQPRKTRPDTQPVEQEQDAQPDVRPDVMEPVTQTEAGEPEAQPVEQEPAAQPDTAEQAARSETDRPAAQPDTTGPDPAAELLLPAENRASIAEVLRAAGLDTPIEELSLTVRAYNCMKRQRINGIAGIIELYPDGFRSFRNVGAKTVDELARRAEDYVREHMDLIRACISGEGVSLYAPTRPADGEDPSAEEPPARALSDITTAEFLSEPGYRSVLIRYTAENDVPYDKMGLSVRSSNAVRTAGLKTLSQIMELYPDGYSGLRNIGEKSVRELKAAVESFAERKREELLLDEKRAKTAGLPGKQREIPEEMLRREILHCFSGAPFKGLHYKEIRELCPAEVSEARLKRAIAKLIRENELEYVDFCCYRKYPSIAGVIESTKKLSDRDKDVISRRFNGETLDSIGRDYNTTRERVRQVEAKCRRTINMLMAGSDSKVPYDEEYYRHFCETYDIPAEFWESYSGVPERVRQILLFLYKKGSAPLEEAISDPELDVPMKIRVSDYLNRNRIWLDGKMVDRNRRAVESFIIRTYCRESTSFDDFVEIYNNTLAANHVEFDPELYITEEVRQSRLNHIADTRFCLWKQGKTLRYYDIDSGDYEELYATLNLEEYENTEVSTQKFVEEYPELMRKYDIRDYNELHNLIRKTVDISRYRELDVRRQPMLQFGKFDRNAAIMEIITVFSPITVKELTEYLHSEYGYSENTIRMTFLSPFSKYLVKGVYDVASLRMPADRKAALRDALTEDMYPIKRIIAIYRQMFPDAPEGELHVGELKEMGFRIYSEFALKNYANLDEYYAHLLTEHGTCTIKDKLRRYSATSTFYAVYKRLKNQYDVFLYEPDGLITFERLAKAGVTREEIAAFTDAVNDTVEDGEYFTMYSLRERGFKTSLDRLGFDDFFLSEILAEDPRFARQHVFGTTVFCKTDAVSSFSTRDFLLALLSDCDSVEIDDFEELLKNDYGIGQPDRYKIIEIVRESAEGYFYDNIMMTIYRNKSRYLSEFDD